MRQPKLTAEKLKEIYIACPPTFVESAQIGNHVRLAKAEYARLISKCEKQINLLHERRTALISAAVTGKIDVRKWKSDQTKSRLETING
jgi:type I restriction enzyme S subunit